MPSVDSIAIKIAELNNVREHTERDIVELWHNNKGRMVIRAFNECHNNHTDVDLFDLLEWVKSGNYDSKSNDTFSPLSFVKRDK